MLAGLIRDDERRSLDGIPGVCDLPQVGKMFEHNTKSSNQTDIVLTLTPHIVRVPDLNENDLRPFRVSRDPISQGPLEIPNNLLPPPPVGAPPQSAQALAQLLASTL